MRTLSTSGCKKRMCQCPDLKRSTYLGGTHPFFTAPIDDRPVLDKAVAERECWISFVRAEAMAEPDPPLAEAEAGGSSSSSTYPER